MTSDDIVVTLQNQGLKTNCDVQLDVQTGDGVFNGASFSPNNSASGSITGLVYNVGPPGSPGPSKSATYQTALTDIGGVVKIKIGPPTGSNQNPACNPQSSYEQYTYEITCAPKRGDLKIIKMTEGGDATFDILATPTSGTAVAYQIATTGGKGQQTKSVPVGTYTISETPPVGWEFVSVSCDNGGTSATVAQDKTTTCTVTNRRQTGNLTIEKKTVGGVGSFPFKQTGGPATISDFTLTTSLPEEPVSTADSTFTSLPTGDYLFDEDLPDGWTLTAITCSGTGLTPTLLNGTFGTGRINVASKASGTCTFTNEINARRPTLTLIKKVVGGPASASDFTLSFAGPTNGSGVMGDDAITEASVDPGTYDLSESGPLNYDLTSLTCNGSNVLATKTVTLSTDPVTCEFTNTYLPPPSVKTLTLKKTVINDDGLSAQPTDFTLSFTGQGGSGNGTQGSAPVTNAKVAAGAYTLSENGPAGYVLKSLKCDGSDPDGSDGLTIAANDGAVTCTFTNDDLKDNRAEEETKRFVNRRVDNLLTYGPNRARILQRLGEAPPEQQSLKDGPMKLNGATAGTPSPAPTSRTSGMTTSPFGARGSTGSMALGANPFSTEQTEPLDPSRPDLQVQSGPTSTGTGVLSHIAGQLLPSVQDSGSVKFSTSLSELRAVASAAEQQRQNDLIMKAGLNFAEAPYIAPATGLRPGFDVWVEGQIARYNDDLGGVNRDGDFSILYVGADYVVSPGVLIGALVQVDSTDEDIDDPTLKGNYEGTGWMAGPYIGFRLADNLYFDARAAWGQSDNDMDLTDPVLGQRTGSFETDRWLASATLTGNEYYGAWRFTPQVSIAYGEESYDSYTTSLQQLVPADSAQIGRVTGTMEVGYRFNGYDGSIIEPHIAVSGIWNFDSDDLYVNGILADTDENRARVEGGLLITTPSGLGIRGAAAYDGIGASDFEAVSGSLWLNIPLN